MAGLGKVVPSCFLISLLTSLMGYITHVEAIDCYKCTSINGKIEECEDKFDRGINTVHLISRECVYGYFKGTHCIKLTGHREDGTKITVRDCSDANWGNHCGDIRYLYGDKEQMINGCLSACDHDGCNAATTHVPSYLLVVVLLPVIAILTFAWQQNAFTLATLFS